MESPNIKNKISYAFNTIVSKASFKKALEIFYGNSRIKEEVEESQARMIEKSQEPKLGFMTTLGEKVFEKILFGVLWTFGGLSIIGFLVKISPNLAGIALLGLLAKGLYSILKGINFFAEPYLMDINEKASLASWCGDKYSNEYYYCFETPSTFLETLKDMQKKFASYHEYCEDVNYYNELLSKTSIATEYNLKPLENTFTLGMQYQTRDGLFTVKDYIDKYEVELLNYMEYFSSLTFTESTFTKEDFKQMKDFINKTHQVKNYMELGFDRLTNKESYGYEVHYNEVFGDEDLKSKVDNLKKIEQDISQVLSEIKAYLSLNPSNPMLQLKFNTIRQKLLFAQFNLSVLTKNTIKEEIKISNEKSEELKKALSDMNDKLVALGKVQQEINFLLNKEVVNPTSAIRCGEVISKMMVV